jgi:hypothetical protein
MNFAVFSSEPESESVQAQCCSNIEHIPLGQLNLAETVRRRPQTMQRDAHPSRPG